MPGSRKRGACVQPCRGLISYNSKAATTVMDTVPSSRDLESTSMADTPLPPPGRGPKGHTVSRRLQRQTVLCPGGCGKTLQLASLAYSHACKRPRPDPPAEVVEERLRKMAARAAEKFERRAAKHGRVQMCSTHMDSTRNADTEGCTDGADRDNAGGADAARTPSGSPPRRRAVRRSNLYRWRLLASQRRALARRATRPVGSLRPLAQEPCWTP